MTTPTAQNLHFVKCSDCLQQSNVEYIGVAVGSPIPLCCPYCGSTKVLKTREDAYWKDLSESLGFGRDSTSVDLIKEMYKLWVPTEYARFRDFVEASFKEEE